MAFRFRVGLVVESGVLLQFDFGLISNYFLVFLGCLSFRIFRKQSSHFLYRSLTQTYFYHCQHVVSARSRFILVLASCSLCSYFRASAVFFRKKDSALYKLHVRFGLLLNRLTHCLIILPAILVPRSRDTLWFSKSAALFTNNC